VTVPLRAPVPLWVIVPAYNEQARIGATLEALAGQTDTDFTLLVVDNNSTDGTADVVRSFRAPFPVVLLTETDKGVGCAVDTGFRHAIAQGAGHLARTDADCLPSPGWIAAARAALSGGGELACGRITARRDEHGLWGRTFFRSLVILAAFFGRIRLAHRGREFKAPYRMHAGNNMAVTADLYEACGGMPRRPSPTDRAFLNRVRRTTPAIVHSRAMVVANSTRRIRAYGVLGTARWYLDRGSGLRTADPR
jgi:glycosyltransferase involved in cell wall biosynthesis